MESELKSRAVPDSRQLGASAKFMKLNLSSVTLNAVKKLGWSLEEAERVEMLYRRFLFLCEEYPTVVVPSDVIDAYWELHVLDTRQYFNDCMTLFGRFLHHVPNALARERGMTPAVLQRRFEDTKALYQSTFGAGMEDAVMSGCDDCIPVYDPPTDPEPAPDGVRRASQPV